MNTVEHQSESSPEFSERIRNTTPWLLGIALLVAVLSAFARRGLHADGAYYVLCQMDHQSFCLVEPSRLAVQFAQQAPTALAVRTGLAGSTGAAISFGLTTGLLPIVFIAASYRVLPPARKALVFFPLLHYFAGATAASFCGIAEGPVAAAYFWLLFYLVLFSNQTGWTLLVLVGLALPVPYLHESMVFLAPLLSVAAFVRARAAQSRAERIVFWSLVVWFLVAVAVQGWFIANPRWPANRDTFIQEFARLLWLTTPWGYTNVPAALGLLAILAGSSLAFIRRNDRRRDRSPPSSLWITLPYALVCVAAVFASAHFDGLMAPVMQFKARNFSAVLSFPIALLAMASLRRERLNAVWQRTPNLTILYWLAAGTMGWHALSVVGWHRYVDSFQNLLLPHRGLLTWEDTFGHLPEAQQKLADRMGWSWAYPTMSILLSRDGVVSTIIANPATNAWQPFDPGNPQALPGGRFFDFQPYAAALAKQQSERR